MARARWMLSAQQGALKSSQWLRLQSTFGGARTVLPVSPTPMLPRMPGWFDGGELVLLARPRKSWYCTSMEDRPFKGRVEHHRVIRGLALVVAEPSSMNPATLLSPGDTPVE